MEEKKRIRFIDSHYHTLFSIADGDSIEIVYPDGKREERVCTYIDEYHTQVGARVFHICEFAEIMEANGKSYCPAECKEKEERKEAVKGEKKTGTTRMCDAKQGSFSASLSRLARIRHWRWAVLAQFCYVGAQTACWSYLIRYAVEEIPGMTAGFAANYLTGTMVCFFIGRFTGTWLISRFAPHKVLAAYALIAMALCLISAFAGGHVGLIALTLCSAFMSIQYPTIFSLGIKNLGQDTKYGSSFIVMTIIGGGIVTPVMGFVSDAAGNIPTAELIPALCFAVIFIFARFRSQTATN